jgi:GNAT superfamily N-acetyltransferase
MKFRVADESDAAQIAMLHAESWRRTYRGMMTDEFLDGDLLAERLAAWQRRLLGATSEQFVCVAEDDAGLAGFVCAYGDEDPVWGSYIDNLHVEARSTRRGVGTALMLRVAAWLEDVHPRLGVYLWVMEANFSARQFYQRLGAVNAGTMQKIDPGGGSAPNCRYVWPHPTAMRAR